MTTIQKDVNPDTGLTNEEEAEIIDRCLDLEAVGKEDEAAELFDKHIPILPYLADTAKRIMGIKALKESGLNLTAAVKLFGKEWLD